MKLGPGARLGRYEVVRFLGEGATAHVWEVRHVVLGTRHALKVLREGSPSHRMFREGRAQARLDHPNLVPVTDAIDVGDAPALIMPLVDGPPLDALLSAHRLSRADALAVFAGVVAGVAHAHAHGLVHRDLKPANVLLDASGEVVVPRVSDFGLVKADDAYRTAADVRLGSPAYAAPEQLRDAGAADARADVWSLGVILVELLTGARPLPGAPPALDDPRLDALVGSMLQLDPARRPDSAAALLGADLASGPPSEALTAAVHAPYPPAPARRKGPAGARAARPPLRSCLMRSPFDESSISVASRRARVSSRFALVTQRAASRR